MRQPLSAIAKPIARMAHLAAQHAERQPRAGSCEAAEMSMRVGAQAAGQGTGGYPITLRGIASSSFAAGRPVRGRNCCADSCRAASTPCAARASTGQTAGCTGIAISAAAGGSARAGRRRSRSADAGLWPTADTSDHAVGAARTATPRTTKGPPASRRRNMWRSGADASASGSALKPRRRRPLVWPSFAPTFGPDLHAAERSCRRW